MAPAPQTVKDYGPTLAVFRIGFGVMMLLSVLRFWYNGWIEKLYLQPTYFFSYQYVEWVKPLGGWTYGLFALVALSSIGIAVGYRYRLSVTVFFLSFTYVELMDKTTYLNHYYFVSLLALLLFFLPAAAQSSLDARRRGALVPVPAWPVWALRLFVGVVYFYAGLAKLNSDWLLAAQPLAIWLPAKYSVPLLGDLLQQRWVHFAFAWMGAAYDLAIPFLLLWRPTRVLAFFAVVVFHVLTRVLFPIGMFPYIMIVSALVFFEPSFHRRLLRTIRAGSPVQSDGDRSSVVGEDLQVRPCGEGRNTRNTGSGLEALTHWPVVALLLFHLLFPWRYLLHSDELFWTEEGYRFSWRVMLMEKAGYLNYKLVDPTTGSTRTVDPATYLTRLQYKQLTTQPDFILEFAQHLADQEAIKTGTRPAVYAESYVALNGRGSQPYVNPAVDLTTITASTPRSRWLLPFNDTIYGL